MSLLFAEGFGWHGTGRFASADSQLNTGQWASVGNHSITAYATGRNYLTAEPYPTYSGYGPTAKTRTLAATDRILLGTRIVRISAAAQTIIVRPMRSSTIVNAVVLESSGQISCYKTVDPTFGSLSNLLLTTTGVNISENGYLLTDITLHNSAGIVRFYWNGLLVGEATGVDTINAGDGYVDNYIFGGLGLAGAMRCIGITDLTVDDSVQVKDCEIPSRAMTVAGAEADWTPLSSTNVSNVDEIPSDGDTSYVVSATPGDRDSYKATALGGFGRILGVVHQVRARKEDTNVSTIKVGILNNAQETQGSDHTPALSYSNFVDIFETDPDGGGDLDPDDEENWELTLENTSA
jgi:hypothetical protein